MRIYYWGIVFGLCLLTACDDGDAILIPEERAEAEVTVVCSVNGPGDNGYNDAALRGVIEFGQRTGTQLSLIHPADTDEAVRVTEEWKRCTAGKRPRLLILAGSDYETVARERCGGLADNQRVLFFEGGEGLPDRVSTFSICRNGTAYLAGCMAQGCPEAHIVKACPGDMVVEEAASAFASGYMKYSAGGLLEVHTLASDYTGYAMPDSTYRMMARVDADNPGGRFYFPLAGGSNNGIYKFSREESFTLMLVCGMDTDCQTYSNRVPFSVVIDIGRVLDELLTQWKCTGRIADRTVYGMRSGVIDVVVSRLFHTNANIWEDYYEDEFYWDRLYDKYKVEAMAMEEL
jgi:basic membrane protein A